MWGNPVDVVIQSFSRNVKHPQARWTSQSVRGSSWCFHWTYFHFYFWVMFLNDFVMKPTQVQWKSLSVRESSWCCHCPGSLIGSKRSCHRSTNVYLAWNRIWKGWCCSLTHRDVVTSKPAGASASLSALGRVEKSKIGITAYGYCFLFVLWYVETRENILFGHQKFFVGWNLTWKLTQSRNYTFSLTVQNHA